MGCLHLHTRTNNGILQFVPETGSRKGHMPLKLHYCAQIDLGYYVYYFLLENHKFKKNKFRAAAACNVHSENPINPTA